MSDALSQVPTALFIDGEWREGADKDRIEVLNPATEQVLTDVAGGEVADGQAAVDAAAAALPAWSASAPRERAEILRAAYELMVAQADRLAELITLENGKALSDAKGEVLYAAEFFRWFSEEAVRNVGTVGISPSGNNRMLVMHEPVGVAVMITPWNFPAAMATRKIGPALAAGCTMVLKPATLTPLTALAIAQILQQAGVPDGVVNVVTTRHSGPVISPMLADDRVRKLSFTGSTPVGRNLLAQASTRVLNSSMELGGNAPFIVMADADLDAAIEGAMVAKMRNGGEACTAANRFLVHESVAGDFTARLTVAMKALRVGPGLEAGVQVGPLVDAPSREKVEELIEGAVDHGAKVLTGAARPSGAGYFYTPTVLDSVAPDSAILREEIFGPVAPITSFATDDEMVTMANDTEYGLVSYIYTEDLRRGLGLSERLDAGMIGLNRGLVSDPAAPFGGTKQSGLGREGGHEGMLDYMESKYIATNW